LTATVLDVDLGVGGSLDLGDQANPTWAAAEVRMGIIRAVMAVAG
jgi:hypothetical protein